MTTAMRSLAFFKRPVDLLPLILLLCIAPMAEAAPPWNVGYRTIPMQDLLTGESFPVALWYPTPAATAPLFATGSLSPCRFPRSSVDGYRTRCGWPRMRQWLQG